jgi:autotransporter-associated beta strand protein
VNANSQGNFTLNGAIGGSGNVVFTTVGTSNNNLQSTILGAAGTYTGTTTITTSTSANSNYVKAGVDNALPTGTVLTINGGAGPASVTRHTALDLAGFNQTLAGLTNTTGLTNRAQRVLNTSGTPSTLTMNNTSDFTFTGNIGHNTNLGVAAVNLGLTKSGTGTFTLGNTNLYTGATLINAGTLSLATAGTINASSGITINGSTAKLVQTSSTAITPTVTLTQGTLTGSGTVNTVNVGNATGGIISNNNGVAGAALTLGALTFDGAATVNTFSSSATAPIVTTSLATNVAGTVTINPTVPLVAGTYDLISYGGGSIGGGGFAQFALGTTTGASQRQTPLLGNSGTAITLTLGADNPPFWVGDDGDGNWNTVATGNWKFISNSAATTYLEKDNVVFDDLATGAGPINVDINLANVSPTSTTFNNSAKDYVLNSSGTFGIATGSLTKNGTSSLTLTNANTYTGATTINGGTLNLGSGLLSGSLSPSSPITVASGATFAVNQSDTVTQGTDFGVIGGAGGFAQKGTGTTQLALVNTFSGPTSITGGTLQIIPGGRLNSGAYAGAIAISSGSTFDYSSSAGQTLSGVISGQGSLVKGSSSTLTLTNANTFSGSTTVNAGVLFLDNVNALQNTSAITLGGASAATLSTDRTGITISVPITTANTGVSSTIAFATSVSAATGTITLNGPIGGNGNVIFSSPDVGASTGQTQSINLGATGTWTGNTTLTTGNSQVAPRLVNTSGAANVLPVTTVLSMTGGIGAGTGRSLTFDLNGQNQQLAGLQNTLAVDRDQRVTSVAPATLTINNSADYAFGGTIGSGADDGTGRITGAISVAKTGTAKFTLVGGHDYTGNTSVTQGILSQSAPNTLNETSTVTIAASGAFLELNFDESGGAVTDTVDKLFIGGVQQPAGVYKATDNVTDSGTPIDQITGPGTLTVTAGPSASGYTTWATTNAGGQDAELDFDQDGVKNGVEFFMNAAAGFTANPQLNASNTITWPNGGNIPASAYGTQFVIQTSSNLSIWTDVLVGDLTTNTDGPAGSLTYTLTGGSPRFVRLKVKPN